MTRYHGLLKKQPRTGVYTFENLYAALELIGAQVKKAQDGPLAHIVFEFANQLQPYADLVNRFQVVGPVQPRSIPKPPKTKKPFFGKEVGITIKQTLPAIGVDKVWADPEWDGGSTLIFGINDTGIDDYYSTLYFDNRILEHHKEPWIIGNYKHYHARNVAAIFARNNKNGYRGICDKARIYDGQSLNEEGYGDSASVVGEFNWMGSKDPLPDAISCSLGGPHDPVEDEAVKRLWDLGVIVCCATGNSGGFPPPCDGTLMCPADSPEAIAVGATSGGKPTETDPREYLQAWTSRIPDWEGKIQKHYVVAPGLQIQVDDGESPHSGTSVGQPHALGVIGVIIFFLKKYHPEFNQVQRAIQARQILKDTCIDLGYASSGNYTPEEAYCLQGHGRVQADEAMKLAKGEGPGPQPTKIDKVDFYLDGQPIGTELAPTQDDEFTVRYTITQEGTHLFYGDAWSQGHHQMSLPISFTIYKEQGPVTIICTVKNPVEGDRLKAGEVPLTVEAKVVSQ